MVLGSSEIAMICCWLLQKPIDLEGRVLLPFGTAKPQSVSYMRHPLFLYLIISVTLQYETFSIQSLCVGGCEYFQLIVMKALAQAVAAGRGLRAPLSKPSSNIASCCTPVLMQLALLSMCTMVRQHRQSNRRVLKRAWHLSLLFLHTKNEITFLTLGSSVWRRCPKNLRHPWKQNAPLQWFGGTEEYAQICSELIPPWQNRGQVWMLPALFPRKQILSQVHSGWVWIQCLFSTCTLPSLSILKPGSSEDLEQHRQYKTLLICLFCHYSMNALTF